MQLDETKTPIEQAIQLSEWIGHKMHATRKATSTMAANETGRLDWVEFSVLVPVGYPTGWRTRFQMLKMLWKIMKGAV